MAVGTLGLTPVYPDIARDLGLQVDTFGILVGISTLVGGLLQVPMGILADRFRVKYIAVVGLVAAALAPAIWALAPDYRVYALGSAAMGIGTVCMQAGFHTAIANGFRAGGRASAMSLLWVGTSLGSVISLLLFGRFGGGVGWRGVALAICWLPLLALPLTLTMPDTGSDGARKSVKAIGRDMLRYLVHGRALALCSLMVLSSATAFGTQYFIPFVLRGQNYGASATSLLLVPYIIGGICGAPLLGVLSDRFGPWRPLALGMTLGSLALATVAIVGSYRPLLIGCFLILGALANGGPAVLLSSTVDIAARVAGVGIGSALSITRLALSLGPAVAPSLIGLFYLDAGGTATEFALASVFLVTAGLIVLVLRGVRR